MCCEEHAHPRDILTDVVLFAEKTSAADLPHGLTPRRTISDYLRKLSELTLIVLKEKLGNYITREDIQWCITVPAIWDEAAKREMKKCAEIAGLVQGPHCKDGEASPHPAIIVLEPEAASFYCQEEADFTLDDGDKFLVVDAGGGTVDFALHEKVGPPWSKKVKEVVPSSGGLCGGTYVDERFLEFLCQNIRCFRKFAEENSQIVLSLLSWWETIKRTFDGSMPFNYNLDLPPKLARAWEDDDALKSGQVNAGASYDFISVTLKDMLRIFHPVVDQILQLIDQQIVPDLKALMVVGGFAASPYLKRRIEAAFSQKLVSGTIIFPKEPGSAICCGAVAYGVGNPDRIMSCVSKKTYGISVARLFRLGDPPHLIIAHRDGFLCCSKTFEIFTGKGQTVPVDSCVSRICCPIRDDQVCCEVSLFSSSDTDPGYVTDPGVKEEGSFMVHLPSRNAFRGQFAIKVSMYFGRTTIEVKAEGENFGDGELFTMPPVTFERAFERLSLGSRSIDGK